MRKPSFGVTASAIVVLSLIGFFRVIYQPLLPSSPTEYLVTVPTTSSIPAPIVEIEWKRTIEDGQAEAKRRKLGLLIFLIDPSNYYSKGLELNAFRDPDVSRFVNRNFVPVKINLDQYPEWAQTILPVQRLGRYIEPGVDLAVTDQDGKLVNHFIVENPFQYSGPEAVLPFLIDSKARLGQEPAEQPIQMQQSTDLDALALSSPDALPAFRDYVETLKQEFKLTGPGVFAGSSTKYRPPALRYLAKAGYLSLAVEITKSLALSPLYDPIDGGFFREARTSPSSSVIDTSKSASQNACSAVVAAQLSCAVGDPDLRALAADIGNEVIIELGEGDSICASRLNDQSGDLRSWRSSLTEGKLQAVLTKKQEQSFFSFVTKDRGRDQDLCSLVDLQALSNKDFLALRQTLREKIDNTPALSEPDHIAVNGYVAARLFDLFRLTGDTRFLNKAKMLAEQVYSAENEGSIARIYGNRQLGPGWLGTYLGVADCGLANYAATGEIYPLRSGAMAMKMAMQRFRDPRTGLLVNTPVDPSPTFALTSSVPDLADRGRESFTAQAIRLAYHYSIICEDVSPRAEFASFAQSMMVRLNGIMNHGSSVAGGYFDACFDAIQNKAIVVAGPNRVEASIALSKKIPLVPVYPWSLESKDRELCYYLQEGSVMKGPMSLSEVQKKLNQGTQAYAQ